MSCLSRPDALLNPGVGYAYRQPLRIEGRKGITFGNEQSRRIEQLAIDPSVACHRRGCSRKRRGSGGGLESVARQDRDGNQEQTPSHFACS